MLRRAIAVFTGDNHLRPTTWTKHPTLHGDAYVSWRQIIDYCITQSLPLLLLGDLFDSSRPGSDSVEFYLCGLARLERANLPVYYVEGNHDRADPPWPSLTTWARGAGVFVIGGILTYSLSFTNGTDLPGELAAIPPAAKLLLTHQSWLEIQRVGHTDGTFAMIPHGLTMLTGDYHVRGTYTGPAANGEPVIAHSPGATAMQALNEPVDKYFGVLYDDLTVEWQKLETRTVVSATCQTVEELESLLTWIAAAPVQPKQYPEIQTPILRVRYADTIPEAFNRLTAAAGAAYHLFPEPQRQTETQVVDVAAVLPSAFDSLSSAVRELCPEDSPVRAAADRLLRSQDKKAEIDSMFSEFKERHGQTTQSACGISGSPVG